MLTETITIKKNQKTLKLTINMVEVNENFIVRLTYYIKLKMFRKMLFSGNTSTIALEIITY